MDGHNKWSKVTHAKARADGRKGKEFSPCSQETSMGALYNRVNRALNPCLRSTINSAKAVFLPRNHSSIVDPAAASRARWLCEYLDHYEDTINVFTNSEFSVEVRALLNT